MRHTNGGSWRWRGVAWQAGDRATTERCVAATATAKARRDKLVMVRSAARRPATAPRPRHGQASASSDERRGHGVCIHVDRSERNQRRWRRCLRVEGIGNGPLLLHFPLVPADMGSCCSKLPSAMSLDRTIWGPFNFRGPVQLPTSHVGIEGPDYPANHDV